MAMGQGPRRFLLQPCPSLTLDAVSRAANGIQHRTLSRRMTSKRTALNRCASQTCGLDGSLMVQSSSRPGTISGEVNEPVPELAVARIDIQTTCEPFARKATTSSSCTATR
jgi:hypothetical protein